jgi:hypothetical protein
MPPAHVPVENALPGDPLSAAVHGAAKAARAVHQRDVLVERLAAGMLVRAAWLGGTCIACRLCRGRRPAAECLGHGSQSVAEQGSLRTCQRSVLHGRGPTSLGNLAVSVGLQPPTGPCNGCFGLGSLQPPPATWW